MAGTGLHDWRAYLPPTRAWLIIDVAIIVVVTALVLLRGSLVAEASSPTDTETVAGW